MTQPARHHSVCLTGLQKHTVHYRSLLRPGAAPFSSPAWETMVPSENSQKWDSCFIGSALKRSFGLLREKKTKNGDKKVGLANARPVNSPISFKKQHSELFCGDRPAQRTRQSWTRPGAVKTPASRKSIRRTTKAESFRLTCCSWVCHFKSIEMRSYVYYIELR